MAILIRLLAIIKPGASFSLIKFYVMKIFIGDFFPDSGYFIFGINEYFIIDKKKHSYFLISSITFFEAAG